MARRYSLETLLKMAQDRNLERCRLCHAYVERGHLRPIVIDAHHEEMGCPDCQEQTRLEIEQEFLQAYMNWTDR